MSHGILAMRNKNTWDNVSSTWNYGNTKTIRVPVLLAKKIMRYARELDSGEVVTIEKLIDEFVSLKQSQAKRSNRHFNTDTPIWRVFKEFEAWIRWKNV